MAQFSEFLQWTGHPSDDSTLLGLGEAQIAELASRFSRGERVSDLLRAAPANMRDVPVATLQELSRIYQRWVSWQKRLQQIQSARLAAQHDVLPQTIFPHATTPDQLDAALRTAMMCPRDACKDGAQWIEVLRAGIDLWSRCLMLTRKEGKVHCAVINSGHANARRYDQYMRATLELNELAPHRWLAMRRGEREGVLSLTLTVPEPALLNQITISKSQLGPPAQERTEGSLLEELVLNDLARSLFVLLDDEAEEDAIRGSCRTLADLLNAPGLSAEKVGSIFFNRRGAPAAAVVADRSGELLASKEFTCDDRFVTDAVALFKSHGVTTVVIPLPVPNAELLQFVERGLDAAKLAILPVRAAAMAEARVPLTETPLRLNATVASALVLARRAIDPLAAWSSVDPAKIGLADYQHDLNVDTLRQALVETAASCLEQRQSRESGDQGEAAETQRVIETPPSVTAKLNPLVKTIADLKPEMTVQGVVTNISNFGAFVNIGLSAEGLIHVSELSDEFVSDPRDVVRIGQQITARVLDVDRSRGRISLSCKKPRPQHRERGGNDMRPKRSSQVTRADALATLERAFKK